MSYITLNVKDFRDKLDREWAEITAADRAAKEEGTLVGRYIQESRADGYAYYRVVDHTDNIARVEHIDYCDGWTIPMIESMDCLIPLKYVRDNITLRDKWDRLFEEGRKNR